MEGEKRLEGPHLADVGCECDSETKCVCRDGLARFEAGRAERYISTLSLFLLQHADGYVFVRTVNTKMMELCDKLDLFEHVAHYYDDARDRASAEYTTHNWNYCAPSRGVMNKEKRRVRTVLLRLPT